MSSPVVIRRKPESMLVRRWRAFVWIAGRARNDKVRPVHDGSGRDDKENGCHSGGRRNPCWIGHGLRVKPAMTTPAGQARNDNTGRKKPQ
jgi:hypothetical protein